MSIVRKTWFFLVVHDRIFQSCCKCQKWTLRRISPLWTSFYQVLLYFFNFFSIFYWKSSIFRPAIWGRMWRQKWRKMLHKQLLRSVRHLKPSKTFSTQSITLILWSLVMVLVACRVAPAAEDRIANFHPFSIDFNGKWVKSCNPIFRGWCNSTSDYDHDERWQYKGYWRRRARFLWF